MSKNIKKIRGTRTNGSTSKITKAVSVPVAIGMANRSSPPTLRNTSNVTIRRREFVGTASNDAYTSFKISTGTLAVPGYDFNPATARMFPWLSQISGAFERFRFNKLKFDFCPGQSTTTAGRYYAAVDYDYDDVIPNSKAAIMGNMSAVEASIWQPCSLVCDPVALNRDMPFRYVSCTTRGLAIENRTAYSGFLIVAFDTPSANCLVDIWVEYEVELATPVADDPYQQFYPVSDSTTPSTTAVSGAVGGSFGAVVAPATATYPTGPISLVASGSVGTPVFSVPVGTDKVYPPYALDIKNVSGMGDILLQGNYNVTGVAPNDVLGASEALFKWAFLDNTGSSVASSTTSGLNIVSSQGPATGSGGMLGAYITSLVGVSLNTLLSKYPTVRYLVPYLVSSAALGAGHSGFGFSQTK